MRRLVALLMAVALTLSGCAMFDDSGGTSGAAPIYATCV